MAIWTVHEPPPRGSSVIDRAERIELVRDGLNWAALLFPVPWMLVKRLWLVLVIYLALLVVANVALYAVEAPAALAVTLDLASCVIVGLEAAGLRRWTLARRGFKTVDIVTAPSLEEAECRFFASWPGLAAAAPRSGQRDLGQRDIGVIGTPSPAGT